MDWLDSIYHDNTVLMWIVFAAVTLAVACLIYIPVRRIVIAYRNRKKAPPIDWSPYHNLVEFTEGEDDPRRVLGLAEIMADMVRCVELLDISRARTAELEAENVRLRRENKRRLTRIRNLSNEVSPRA